MNYDNPLYISDINTICVCFLQIHVFLHLGKSDEDNRQCCPEISLEVKRHCETFWGQITLILRDNSFHLWLFCLYVNINVN